MSFIHFIKKHIGDINNYTQPSIQWRAGRFANPVSKAEATNGDFAEVVRSLPAELSREDVVRFFQEDLYKGFVATIMWGGISRFLAEKIARNNDRNTTMPKLERLVALLHQSASGSERIKNAVASLKRGGENYFYGIGVSYFTKLLYFLAYDMDLNVRPLIYDENMKPAHFALLPEAGKNPFFYYFPVGDKMHYTQFTPFEEVYCDYCELMCEMAREIGVGVKNLEAWVFGWPANRNVQQSNPRVVARTEVERMAATGIFKYGFGIEDFEDAIGASRVFYDNKIDVPGLLYSSEERALPIGNDVERPIVITETDGYIHLEHLIADILFQLKNQEAEMVSQEVIFMGEKVLDRFRFEAKTAQGKNPKEVDIYFDITAGYNAIDIPEFN